MKCNSQRFILTDSLAIDSGVSGNGNFVLRAGSGTHEVWRSITEIRLPIESILELQFK
jgi:hypothetical protein